jgi:uncharacterized protein (TIGR01244 family)
MRRLDSNSLVAGQILPEQMPQLAAQGVTMIVNNRPDDEEPGQPPGESIRAAAEAAGIDYRFIPVAGGISEAAVEAMAQALQAEGTTLAFCRSGTRSAYLWALAKSRLGAPAEELARQAADAGYDLRPIARFL